MQPAPERPGGVLSVLRRQQPGCGRCTRRAGALRKAIEERQLEVYYQPKLCLTSGRLQAAEALVRWHHPQHGLLGPDRFIGIAEANGLIIDLDLWVMRHACADLAHLHRHGYGDIKVTVNCCQ